MTRMPFEPIVRVGLCEGSPFGLIPEGDFHVSASDSQIVYTPADTDATMLVKGMTIGHGFHWQQRRDLRFRGSFILEREQGHTTLINLVKAEEYLKSVVCSEMSPNSPIEYLKAHAVISRSWLMRILINTTRPASEQQEQHPEEIIHWTQNDRHSAFDVCADDHCQRYQGITEDNANALRAVEQTRSLILMAPDDTVADTRFSKCCGGHTESFFTAWDDIDYPYLQPKPDPYCNPSSLTADERKLLARCMKDYDSVTDYYNWHAHVPATLIRENIKALCGKDLGKIVELKPLERGKSGRISRLLITGTNGRITIGKELTIRKMLSTSHLYSSAFDIIPNDSGFTLNGHGWGHGVGLCQTGAALMAIRGHSAEEILAFYYPDTTLCSAYD